MQTAWSTGSARWEKQREDLKKKKKKKKKEKNYLKTWNIWQYKARNSHRVTLPDIDGCVGQNLAVAVPAAVGGGTAASRMVSAYLAEDLVFAILSQVQLQVWVGLAVTWCEAETPHPVDLNEGQVKLVETERGKKTAREGKQVLFGIGIKSVFKFNLISI